MRKLLMAGLLGLMLIATSAFGQATEPAVQYTWTAPTTGSPVDHYVVQYTNDGGATWIDVGVSVTAETYTFLNVFEYLVTYQVRVAGVDALGRQGPWSVPSDPYMPDQGVPGEPGKPTVIQL